MYVTNLYNEIYVCNLFGGGGLKNNKSTGNDNIPSVLLKACADIIFFFCVLYLGASFPRSIFRKKIENCSSVSYL